MAETPPYSGDSSDSNFVIQYICFKMYLSLFHCIFVGLFTLLIAYRCVPSDSVYNVKDHVVAS